MTMCNVRVCESVYGSSVQWSDVSVHIEQENISENADQSDDFVQCENVYVDTVPEEQSDASGQCVTGYDRIVPGEQSDASVNIEKENFLSTRSRVMGLWK